MRKARVMQVQRKRREPPQGLLARIQRVIGQNLGKNLSWTRLEAFLARLLAYLRAALFKIWETIKQRENKHD